MFGSSLRQRLLTYHQERDRIAALPKGDRNFSSVRRYSTPFILTLTHRRSSYVLASLHPSSL
jgi:hypothetical protein